jgi:hypothetical protein
LYGPHRRINVDEVIDRLAGGMKTLNRDLVEKVQTIMPNGKYNVLLTHIIPKLIRPLDGHITLKKTKLTTAFQLPEQRNPLSHSF